MGQVKSRRDRTEKVTQTLKKEKTEPKNGKSFKLKKGLYFSVDFSLVKTADRALTNVQ